jgi:hypothetical protein
MRNAMIEENGKPQLELNSDDGLRGYCGSAKGGRQRATTRRREAVALLRMY